MKEVNNESLPCCIQVMRMTQDTRRLKGIP
jgi:hypothetical protein